VETLETQGFVIGSARWPPGLTGDFIDLGHGPITLRLIAGAWKEAPMMQMETTRLANVHWLSIPDRQVFALRTAWMSRHGSRARPEPVPRNEPQRLPMLEWPATLFADEITSH
jgi:hypothetical protein